MIIKLGVISKNKYDSGVNYSDVQTLDNQLLKLKNIYIYISIPIRKRNITLNIIIEMHEQSTRTQILKIKDEHQLKYKKHNLIIDIIHERKKVLQSQTLKIPHNSKDKTIVCIRIGLLHIKRQEYHFSTYQLFSTILLFLDIMLY